MDMKFHKSTEGKTARDSTINEIFRDEVEIQNLLMRKATQLKFKGNRSMG
jgi:hypothetical protein